MHRCIDASIPDALELGTVAPGGGLAFGENAQTPGQPTPLLLRSAERTHAWIVEPTFLEQFPGARILNVTRDGDVFVATGWSGSPRHPDAWISTDGGSIWQSLPPALYGAPGSTLSLAGTAGDRIVMLGSPYRTDRAYVDRYYTLERLEATSSEDQPTRIATDTNRPPYTSGIEVGRTYDYAMYTHCGIDKAKIDGTWWRASPPQDDRDGNPPAGWNGAVGTLRIVSEDKAVFTLANGLTATYVRDNLSRLICN